MKANTLLLSAVLALLLADIAHADDTDIYLSGGGNLGGKPLVMFSLDYRSNLGSTVCQGTECDGLKAAGYLPNDGSAIKFFQLLRAVLKKVVDDLGPQLDSVKLGLMMNHDNRNNCAGPTQAGCSNGGYVLLGFTPSDTNNPTNRFAALHDKLAAIPIPTGNTAHPFQGKELYLELFRYLTGQGIYNGHNGWTDYGSSSTQNLNQDNAAISWDSAIEDGENYITPLLDHCSKVFVINFMFAVSQQEDDSDSAIRAAKGSGGMNALNLSGSNDSFSTVIRFMRDADLADGSYGSAGNLEDVQNVTSYFFVDQSQLTQANQKGYASAGGTNTALPLSANPDELIAQLKDVFKQILSISTTFVSAAVPINVFNRSETLENVFFALFQPEATPRWNGNLKRLKLAVEDASGNLLVHDATGTEAISSTDGRIKNEALTFWTNAGGADVVAADTDKGEVSGKDGRSASRGGVGQRIPGFLSGSPGTSNSDSGARQLYTEPASYSNGTATALLALNADASTAGSLWAYLKLNGANGTATWTSAPDYTTAASTDTDANGNMDSVDAINLLKFARGLDVYDEDGDGNRTEAHPWATPAGGSKKPWLMADPLHSKPTPINYGATTGYSAAVPDIRILVAGNDGYLHMIRNSVSGGSPEGPSGVEDWAFMPRPLAGNLKPLAGNAAARAHIHGFDGTAAVYVNDANSNGTIETGDKVYAYMGMRRGGKAYYALDISDPNAAPKILWSIKKTSGGDFDELGWTFSDPVVARLNWGLGDKPVVIFAGGYDTNKDARSTTTSTDAAPGTDDSMGNAIYIVNAETGALVWKVIKGTGTGAVSASVYQHARLKDSIPSAVTAVDTDGDELADRLYVGDTGGVIWRADLPKTTTTAANGSVTVTDGRSTRWSVTKLLSVGRHDGRPDRRFFHRPDFVRAQDANGPFDAVVIGSGDRAHPLDRNVQNQFYMFKDINVTSGSPPSAAAKTVDDLDDLTSTSASPAAGCGTDTGGPDCGWRFDLGSSASGEKALASPLTFFGKVFFSTYVPTGASVAGSCGPNEGTASSYVVNLFNALGVHSFNTSNDQSGITRERSYTSGAGIPSDPFFISMKGKQYITPGNMPTQPEARSPLEGKAIWKTFWYEPD